MCQRPAPSGSAPAVISQTIGHPSPIVTSPTHEGGLLVSRPFVLEIRPVERCAARCLATDCAIGEFPAYDNAAYGAVMTSASDEIIVLSTKLSTGRWTPARRRSQSAERTSSTVPAQVSRVTIPSLTSGAEEAIPPFR